MICSHSAHGQSSGNSPTFKLSGDVSLLSQYVEYGLTQSDNSPALQGSFWFNFGPQFRLGLWGSNTNYHNSDDKFNLRMNADIKVDFSATTYALVAYSHSQYYNGGNRNGDLLSFHLHFGKIRVMYDAMSNWEGTSRRSTRYAFGGEASVFGDWKWDNEGGYNTPDVSSISPYFDIRTGLGKMWSVIFVEAAVTGTSASSDLNGAGDVFFILSAKTEL